MSIDSIEGSGAIGSQLLSKFAEDVTQLESSQNVRWKLQPISLALR